MFIVHTKECTHICTWVASTCIYSQFLSTYNVHVHACIHNYVHVYTLNKKTAWQSAQVCTLAYIMCTCTCNETGKPTTSIIIQR